MLHFIPGNQYVIGAVAVNGEIFVLQYESDGQVRAYDGQTFTLTRHISIPDVKNAHSVAGCSYNSCLYVGDTGHKCVHRIDIETGSVKKFTTGDPPRGISLTKSHNLLVTTELSNKIKEYTTEGSLIREISIDASMDRPQHAKELPNGQFVVSHLGSAQHRVCVVDTSGCVVKSYGGSQGSRKGQLKDPRRVEVDCWGNIFVADCSNDRIELLSQDLAHLGYIHLSGYQLSRPYTLHLDEESGRLYVGEWVGKVVVILLGDSCLSTLSSQVLSKVI